MTDKESSSLFFERSEQAIGELAKKHGRAAERVVRNILGDRRDTEECLSDTWLGVWNAIPPNRPELLQSFVCKIARNLATKRYHAGTARKRDGRYDLALDELSEFIYRIRAASRGCSPVVARMAGMSYGTAAVRLHRAREKLKKQLLKEGVLI